MKVEQILVEGKVTMVMQVGKRYFCETCAAEVLVTKPGEGSLSCCGHEMPVLQPKATPSSD